MDLSQNLNESLAPNVWSVMFCIVCEGEVELAKVFNATSPTWRINDLMEISTQWIGSSGSVYMLPRGVHLASITAANAEDAIRVLNEAFRSILVPNLGPSGHIFAMACPKGSERYRIHWWPKSLEKEFHACWDCNGWGYTTRHVSCSSCGGSGRQYIQCSRTVEVEVNCWACSNGRVDRNESNGYAGYPCSSCYGEGKKKELRTEYYSEDNGSCGACGGKGSWTESDPCRTCKTTGRVLERYFRKHKLELDAQKAHADHDASVARRATAPLKMVIIFLAFAAGILGCLLFWRW